MHVLEALRSAPRQGRAALARGLGVSKPTISQAVAGLLAQNLVFEVGPGESRGGRPPVLLELNTRAGYVIGAHVGGTNLRIGIADLTGRVLVRTTARTQHGDPVRLATQIVDSCGALLGEIKVHPGGLLRLVVAAPGVWNPSDGRWELTPTLPELADRRVYAALQRRFNVPIQIENDVRAAGIAEWKQRGPGGADILAFLTIGTGFGAAIIAGGQIFRGAAGRAGEIGEFPLGNSTIERHLSGPGLAAAHRDAGGSGTAEDAIREAIQGCEPGASVLARYTWLLARVVVGVALTVDPSRVILGGGLGVALEPLLPELGREMARIAPYPPPVSVSSLHGDTTLLGAIGIGIEEAWTAFGRERRLIGSWLG